MNPVHSVDPSLDKSGFTSEATVVGRPVAGVPQYNQPYGAPAASQNTYGQQPQGQYSGVYAHSPQPVYATHAQPQQVAVNGRMEGANGGMHPIRPVGTWGDTICDWTKNLFPSCYCACCACHGIWILGQMAEKHGFGKLNTMITIYIIVWIVAIILDLALRGNGQFVIWLPFICVLAYTCALRVFIAKKDNITECGSGPGQCMGECCTAFWCVSCSISQMARYTYGYTQVLDGDGAINRPDNYQQLNQQAHLEEQPRLANANHYNV